MAGRKSRTHDRWSNKNTDGLWVCVVSHKRAADGRNAGGCARGEYGKEENYQVRNICLNDVFLKRTEGTLALYQDWAG